MTAELQAAYAACRAIARKRAKNFFYAFVALPANKRDAICAVYAFMRQADDLSDDESLSIADRRVKLETWLEEWHQAQAGAGTSDPVFIAMLDAQRRFTIPSQLLDQLVQGTATDLEPRNAVYATFPDLYRYCYLVASVVGLVCIRIFGYLDPSAEKLAEETGIAFQLTNILRDVREDAERGRLYLPLEDLERCGVAANSMSAISNGQQMTPQQRQVLAIQAERAGRFYKSAEALLPLISPDSRAAMWVLVTIYHRLLRHIEQRNFDVFSARVRVPAYEKLSILGAGLFKTLAQGVWA
ncbi:MAG: phytoene/squalene synthase family protein [Acidobacteriaceae bacterium]